MARATTEFLIVDSSSLSIIYRASREAGLDALKSYGKQIVVTKTCFDELRNFDGATSVKAWVDSNAIIPDYVDTELKNALGSGPINSLCKSVAE